MKQARFPERETSAASDSAPSGASTPDPAAMIFGNVID